MRKVNKIISTLLCLLLVLTSVPITALADGAGVGDNDNGGGGGGSGSTGGSFTWQTHLSGYRFALVDKDMNQVSNTVDFVFSNPSSRGLGFGNDQYTNSRVKPLSTSKSEYLVINIQNLMDDGFISTVPKFPVQFEGTRTKGGGEDFKKWFLNNEGGLDSIETSPPPPPAPPRTGSGKTKPTIRTGTGNGGGGSSASYDMSPVAEYRLTYDSGYRSSVQSRSASYVTSQGYYNHAWDYIYSEAATLKRMANIKSNYTGMSYTKALESNLDLALGYYRNVGKSYAEIVYMYAATINLLMGSSWTATSYYATDLNSPIFTANNFNTVTPTIEDKGLTLDKIPLAKEKANADAIINCYSGSSYTFKFNSSAVASMPDKSGVNGNPWTAGTKSPLQVVQEYNYYVIVEPIFWFRPANGSSRPSSPVHGNYVYGTVNNFVDFYKNQGSRYGAYGGAYGVLCGSLAWQSFYTGKDWSDSNGNTRIVGATPGGRRTVNELYSMWHDDSVGFAMHMYTTSGRPSNQQVTGDPSWATQGPAPDPASKKVTSGYKKEYNIIKYYEEVDQDDDVTRQGPFYRGANPPEIAIVNEKYYKVDDWFISKQDFSGNPTETVYSDAKAKYPATSSGTGPATVYLEKNKADLNSPDVGERTLFVKLTRRIGPSPDTDSLPQALILNESEISKAVTTEDTEVPTWGKRTFTFNYASMSGSDTHYCGEKDCKGHSCSASWGDYSYEYNIENSSTVNSYLEGDWAGGIFKSEMLNTSKSGSASMGGGSDTVSDVEYKTVFYRGNDIPTIASYKESSSIPLRSLLNKYGTEPVNGRGLNGYYTIDFSAKFDVASSSDLSTHTVHGYTGNTWHSSTHTTSGVDAHLGTVNVNVYGGTNKKEEGKETVKTEVLTTTPFGGANSMHSAGYMVQSVTPIYFYPYVRMTYMGTNDTSKTDVSILSQYYSGILPNDFAEAAWYNPNESESMLMSSVQWSLHAKAVNGGLAWNGKNQVLPGGAIYQLSHGDTPTKVSLVTWQTLVDDNVRASLYGGLPLNDYTIHKANAEHDNYVTTAKQVIEELRLVQWVNADPKATNAWSNNGKSVKITEGGQSLSALGLSSNKTSSERKYRLESDKVGDGANQGDLDVLRASDSTDVYYKVFATPDGSVYLAKSVGDMSQLTDINGTNPTASGAVTVSKILSQTDKVADVPARLTGEAKELNNRTLIVTNLVKTLERNKGNDKTASWVSNGRWYNEAFDGVMVVRKATTLDVGFERPNLRSAVIDPQLMPVSKGKGDMFTQAFLSQFRVDSKSEAKDVGSKSPHYIGSFQGTDIFLKDMEDMYKSKKFYIPNVSVQDLY